MWNRGVIPRKDSEVLEPDAEGTSHALSRIGYSLGDAVADIIDNSIDANASLVLIRLFRNDSTIDRIVIADNGTGMNPRTLRHAMQYGARMSHKKTDLGKYGIGLKTASFSQCSSLSVVSRFNGRAAGRRWTRESMGEGWYCDILEGKSCNQLLNNSWQDLDLQKSGTLVVWDELEHIRPSSDGVDVAVQKTLSRLGVELGIRFHRFIKKGQVSIILDAQQYSDEGDSIALPVIPLDPFDYVQSGHSDYPKKFPIKIPGVGSITAEAHIWPPKSRDQNYRLGGGKVSARQGFYFYRNDRVIQAGGWNHTREDDAEPHSSLARVRIDLPPKLDSAFSLNVQKSKVDVPVAFNDALQKAEAGGVLFKQYLKAAEDTYRGAKRGVGDDFPLVPGEGISSRVRKKALDIYADKDSKVREIKFVWKQLAEERIFEINLYEHAVCLNSLYRHEILGGARASKNDVEILKLIIFHMTRDYFDKQRLSAKIRKSIADCNSAILEAVKKIR